MADPKIPPPLPTDLGWEYKVITLEHWESELAEEELNQLGMEKWELVGVGLTLLGKGRLIFKRRHQLPQRSF